MFRHGGTERSFSSHQGTVQERTIRVPLRQTQECSLSRISADRRPELLIRAGLPWNLKQCKHQTHNQLTLELANFE